MRKQTRSSRVAAIFKTSSVVEDGEDGHHSSDANGDRRVPIPASRLGTCLRPAILVFVQSLGSRSTL